MLKWLTSAKSADAVAVIRAKLENTELIVGDSPKVHAKEPRPINAFEVESASIDTAHDERKPGGWWPFREDLYRGPGWDHSRVDG